VIGAHVLRDRWSPRAAQLLILGASLAFFASDRLAYLPLLVLSVAFNWGVSRQMASPGITPRSRKALFITGLVANVAFLCVFKYANAVAVGIGLVTGRAIPLPNWEFPLGISFFTITQVMYLVDCYEKLVPANSLLDHATFVSFFPNITAGPLVRAKLFAGQLGKIGGQLDRDDRLVRGLMLLAIGLFKKVVLADSFARIANAGYANVGSLSTLETWLTALAYTFQMYFDFSGYSDMAFGAARLSGIELVRNFNAPYRAVNISDFWQRWHISLSTFITTYLYTPIARSMGRVTVHTSALATLIAMTIAGLWHGASWTFLLFYAMHGFALAAYQYWKRSKRKLPRPLAMVLTFAFVNLCFVVFRAPDVMTALHVARGLLPSANLLGFSNLADALTGTDSALVVLPIIIGSIAAFAGPTSDEFAAGFRPSRRFALGTSALVLAAFVFMIAGSGSGFIYRAF